MKNRTFCFYGISGLYNYGCEATIRGIAHMIKQKYPESNILYFSYNYEKDKQILADTGDVIVKPIIRKSMNFFARAFRKFCRLTGLARPEEHLTIRTDWLKDCDTLILVGGDVFNLQKKDENKTVYSPNERIYVSRIAKKHGANIVGWGISAGPYDNNSAAKKVILDFFKETVDLLIVRETKTEKYLKDNGVNNVVLYNDPAFTVSTIKSEGTNREDFTVGINLSPLANRYLNNNLNEESNILKWSEIIQNWLKILNVQKTILIPHVVTDTNYGDDDYRYLKKIETQLLDRGIDVKVSDNKNGFIGIKDDICKCDLIIASRMHCAVNSITCAVPTVLLAYSPKAEGMCQQIYGDISMYIDMNDIVDEKDFSDMLSNIKNKIPEIHEFLLNRSNDMKQNAELAINDFVKVLS